MTPVTLSEHTDAAATGAAAATVTTGTAHATPFTTVRRETPLVEADLGRLVSPITLCPELTRRRG